MSGNVLEFFIKMTDLTGRAIASATTNVKKFARNVATELGLAKKTLDNGLAPEKFIRTEEVLNRFALAMDRAGVKGKDFADAYDTLQTRLNEFNKTGENADALVQHFKASMEDLGFSAKQVESGLAMLQKNMIKAGNSSKEAATRFSALRVMNAALRGDISALVAELTKIVPAFREAGVAGSKGMFIAGAAVVSVIKLLGALKDLVKTAFQFGKAPKEVREIGNRMADIRTHAAAFAESMETARDFAKSLSEQLNSEIDALERLTKAQNELARAQELATANSKYETDEINAKYDRLNAEAEERAAKSRRNLQKSDLEEEAKRLEEEIKEAEKRRDEARKMSSRLLKAAKDSQGGWGRKLLGWVASPFGLGDWASGRNKTDSILAGQTNAANMASEAEDELNKLRDKLVKIKIKQRSLENEEKAAAIDVETRKQTEANEEYKRDVAEWKREVKEYEKELRRATKERERLEREAAKAAKARHKELMRDAKEELKAKKEIAAAAQSRLEAAKDYAAKAWGFYLDRDSLTAHNSDVDKNIEARKQYEKDREQITTGRYADKFTELMHIARKNGHDAVESQLAEWRKKKSISLDTEAIMRVALSENEQKEALRDLQRSADAAEDARNFLEQIAKELQETE